MDTGCPGGGKSLAVQTGQTFCRGRREKEHQGKVGLSDLDTWDSLNFN